jgi:hypothetical protein
MLARRFEAEVARDGVETALDVAAPPAPLPAAAADPTGSGAPAGEPHTSQ